MATQVVLEPGKTILLDGPASALVISGLVSVFGAELRPRRRLVVRKGRRMPLEALEASRLEVVVGEGGSYSIVDGSPIPPSWREVAEELSEGGPRKIVVLGGVDVGKTSLCTYLANMAVGAGRSVGLVDADVGQSDIGPPCTIGFARMVKPILDLSELRAEQAFFLGDKTPSHMMDEALKGIEEMMRASAEAGVDLLIINTDGWISGQGAIEYKRSIASTVEPDLILALQRGVELEPIIRALEGWEVRVLEVSPFVKERDREVRRELRAQGYRRYLEGARVISIQLDWVEVEGRLPGSGLKPSRERIALIASVLGIRPLLVEEDQEKMTLVFEGEAPDEELISRLEEAVGKEVDVFLKGEEKGLLVALYGREGRFLGIGVVVGLDCRKKAIRVFTPVDEDAVAKIC
ncbi:hypothetical protein DRO32_01515, partial [Candidatus Bathyarchaeota archaeon]